MITRFTDQTGITVSAQQAYNVTLKRDEKVWGHYDTNDGRMAHVGHWYKTKAELLADHESYLIRAGWLRSSQATTGAEDTTPAHRVGASENAQERAL